MNLYRKSVEEKERATNARSSKAITKRVEFIGRST